jgi:hypothetical protein
MVSASIYESLCMYECQVDLSFSCLSSLDTWTKQIERGAQCLSRQVLGQSSTELDEISDECKCEISYLLKKNWRS